MENLQVFENESLGQVRVVEIEGEIWFVANDVCRILELSNPTVAMQRLDEDERSKFNLGRQGKTNVVNEYGLYELIFGSRKKEAKEFKRWVKREVLPSIRKTGSYSVQNELPDYQKEINELQNEIVELEEEIQQAFDSYTLYSDSDMALILRFKTTSDFLEEMAYRGLMLNVRGNYKLHPSYKPLGYTVIEEIELDGQFYYERRWTKAGNDFLVEEFKDFSHLKKYHALSR